MRAAELLAYLEGNGFHLWIDGDELLGDGPDGLLTDELLSEIREAKVELLVILQGDRPAVRPKPRRQGPESWPLENELAILGAEGLDLAGEDQDLAKLPRTNNDDWRLQISKY